MCQDTPTLDEQMREILESYDFVAILSVMEVNGWRWLGVDEKSGADMFFPTVEDMQVLARHMLRTVAGKVGDNTMRTAGFVAAKRHGLLSFYFTAERGDFLV